MRSAVPGLMHPIAQPAPVRFGLVADLHYARIEPMHGRYYAQSRDKLREAVALMNARGVDFLVELGDLKDQPPDADIELTLDFLSEIEAQLRRFDGPTYHVLGNHDLDCLDKATFLAHVTNTGIEPGRAHYAFDHGPWRFIVLDGCFSEDGRPYAFGQFDWTEARLPDPQLGWLGERLGCGRPTIVFLHHRLDTTGAYALDNAVEVRTVLETCGDVRAVFQGHEHEGACTRLGGIPYYTLPGMVEGEGPENNGYAIVELRPDGAIAIEGFRRAPSHRLRPAGA